MLKGYSTKQNPQGVFLYLSRPIMMRLMSAARENSSCICSSVVWNERFPIYNVVDTRKA